MLAEANAVVETVSVQDLPYHLDEGDAVLLDVREEVEIQKDGTIPGAMHASRGLLEFYADPESQIHKTALRPDRRVILFCGTGGRSALAAKTLYDMGFKDVATLAGGYAAWRSAEQE